MMFCSCKSSACTVVFDAGEPRQTERFNRCRSNCVDRGINRNTGVGDIRAFVVIRDVQRGSIGGDGKTEGRQEALRPDAAGAGQRAATLSCRD